MELLVKKFSNGKYENESELFAEPISEETVKLMGEMIALQSLRTIKKYNFDVADKLYVDYIKDLHHMVERDYVVTDGYDCAQIAICFLWQFAGKSVYDDYGKDRIGKNITIKLACYREVGRYIDGLCRKAKRTEHIDVTDYKAYPVDPVNCFEKEEWTYDKADEIIKALNLSGLELSIINCCMYGMTQSQIMAELGIGRGRIWHRKASIRKRYLKYSEC